jgi:hypothetical protein
LGIADGAASKLGKNRRLELVCQVADSVRLGRRGRSALPERDSGLRGGGGFGGRSVSNGCDGWAALNFATDDPGLAMLADLKLQAKARNPGSYALILARPGQLCNLCVG